MSNALQVFNYKAKEVRTTIIDGEVWFVAKDVCDILELSNAREAISVLDEDEKNTVRISDGTSGNPNMNVINEPGLYALILRSNKPEAKQFSRWMRHEVLPSIRKTGSYSMFKDNPAIPSGVIESAKLIFETAGIKDNQLALALDKVHKSYTGRSALEAGGITLTAPTQNQILTPTEIGSHFGVNAHRVNEILAGAGYQRKINGRWEVLQPGRPYAIVQYTGNRHTDGTPVRLLKWDGSILNVFHQLLCA